MSIELTEKQKERTRKNLIGVHPHLVQVVERAQEITTVPFVVTEGLRTLDRQKQLKAAGKSWTLNSRHLTGHAVDLVDADDFKYDIPDMTKIHDAMLGASKELGIPLVWGGDWKQRDTPHFELDKRSYPSNGVGTTTRVLETAAKVAANRVVLTGAAGGAVVGAQEAAEKVAATPTPVIDPTPLATLPSPPLHVTENLSRAGEWKGAGQTAMSFIDFAQSQPYLFGALALTVAILLFGPRIAKRLGWEV
ncbi:peptidoglycan LD-endopeptidase CwlK [Hyphomicrobium sp. 1Nfss2.1]|uniref:M15 family metallopeptidase n=1 Tax=Hyphomicrobium sp. 1Nfss2.1 TaxID=3413936 RepID=UPI003C7E19A0